MKPSKTVQKFAALCTEFAGIRDAICEMDKAGEGLTEDEFDAKFPGYCALRPKLDKLADKIESAIQRASEADYAKMAPLYDQWI